MVSIPLGESTRRKDRVLNEYETIKYGTIAVCHTPALDGGGPRYGQDFVRFVREHFGRVGRVLEWCAGPGYIGFSLLANDLCATLDLAEINPIAVEACRETIRLNSLRSRARVFQSDGLDGLPVGEHWDLVVANPPHYGQGQELSNMAHRAPILYMDAAWALHQRFYGAIRAFLEPTSSVVLQENHRFSHPEDFRQMIAAGGLDVVAVEECPAEPAGMYYYIWTQPYPDPTPETPRKR